MGSLFGGGGGGSRSHYGSREARGVRPVDQQLEDLLNRALTGSLYPSPLSVPTPISRGIGGIEAMLPSLFGQAFGPTRGLAGMLGGRPMDPMAALTGGFVPGRPGTGSPGSTSSLGSPIDLLGLLSAFPSWGATPSREELGLQDPTLVPPGFLPPEETIQENLGGVHRGGTRREQRLEGTIAAREARATKFREQGREGRARKAERGAARAERKLGRYRRRNYVEGSY